MPKRNIWDRICRIIERVAVKTADKLPFTALKTWDKHRKANQVYTHAEARHEKAMERKEQLIEKAHLQNEKLEKQISLQDIRIEKERLKLEKLMSKK